MRILLPLTVTCALLLAALPANAAAQSGKAGQGIVAVVNDRAITNSDLKDRTNLLIKSAGLPSTPELEAKLRQQVLNMLIDEQLKLQAAEKNGVKVEEKDIDQAFASVAAQNKMTAEQFAGVLSKQGLRLATLRDQMRAEVAWGQVVSKRLRPRIDVSDADILAEQTRLQSAIGKTQYNISEIFLAVDKPEDDARVKDAITKLYGQVKSNPKVFPQVAQQFSQAAGAAQGGELGWVEAGALPEALAAAVPTVPEGGISEPVRSLSGYHIVLVKGQRTLDQAKLPSREQLYEKIGTERLIRAARSYMQDLKRSAFIERRV
jgi:peptidyl-prolyl cis-trans isomerase SurA